MGGGPSGAPPTAPPPPQAPEHTPKNRLLLAGRLRAGVPATRAAQEEGLAEYVALKSATGGAGIALEGLLGSVGIRT